MSYSVKVIDHYENPRNVGTFGKDDDGVMSAMLERCTRLFRKPSAEIGPLQIDGAVPGAALDQGGGELDKRGGQALRVAGQSLGEGPGCLPRRQPHGLCVVVRVTDALADGLERGDGLVELLAVLRVLGGERKRCRARTRGHHRGGGGRPDKK